MASVKRQSSCTICGKFVGVFSCHGCDESFCLQHTNEHRERLQKSMDEIVKRFHEVADQSSTIQRTDEQQHSLIEQVNDWEKQSINKIRQMADDTRHQVANSVHERSNNTMEQIRRLQQQLDKAHKDGGFFENDLREWSEKINRLKFLISYQQTIKFDDDKDTRTFIPRISISEPAMDSCLDDHGSTRPDRKISKNCDGKCSKPSTYAVYSSGRHPFLFKIDDYQPNDGILFGISSQKDVEYTNPLKSPTLFGWGERDHVYIDGKPLKNFDNYRSDFQKGDICEIVLDCATNTISLQNRRVNRRYELNVSPKTCPLPWLLHVHIFDENVDISDNE